MTTKTYVPTGQLQMLNPTYAQNVEKLLMAHHRGKLVGWDEIRQESINHFGENPVPCSWGTIAQDLIRRKIITKTSIRQRSCLSQCHGREVPVYKVN